MIPDPREWVRWADEPDTGQALRFHVSRRWPFPLTGWTFRGSEDDHDALYVDPRYEAFTSHEAATVQDWLRMATILYVNRRAARRAPNGRAFLREGLSHLRVARALILAGKWDTARGKVVEAHNEALKLNLLAVALDVQVGRAFKPKGRAKGPLRKLIERHWRAIKDMQSREAWEYLETLPKRQRGRIEFHEGHVWIDKQGSVSFARFSNLMSEVRKGR